MNSIGGQTIPVVIDLTVSATTYSAGKQVGSLNTIPNVAMAQNRTCSLVNVLFIDKSGTSANVNTSYNLWFFNQSVTLPSSNNTALSLNSTVSPYVVGRVKIQSTDLYSPGAAGGVIYASLTVPNCALVMQSLNPTGNLYCVLEVDTAAAGSATFTGTTNVQIKLTFGRDF